MVADLKELRCKGCKCVFYSTRRRQYCEPECYPVRPSRCVDVSKKIQRCKACDRGFTAQNTRSYCTRACRPSSSYEAKCAECGDAFRYAGGATKHCSKACRSKRAAKASAKRRERQCERCGDNFQRNPGRNTGRFCSRSCGWSGNRQINADPVAHVRSKLLGWSVPICKITGERVSKVGQYSEAGRVVRRNEINKKRRELKYLYECQSCADKFIRIGLALGSRTQCSSCCGKKSKGRTNNHRQRARKYGRKFSSFKQKDIFRRDKYQCQLCGVKCKKYKELDGHYHDEMVTLDHIIPLSKGGNHVAGNCWTLCSGCNTEKGSQGPLSYGLGPHDEVYNPRFYNHIETLRSRRSDAYIECGFHTIDNEGCVYVSDANMAFA